jgi:hypothetical protein
MHLIRLRDNEYWLLWVSNHMIADNVSWDFYFDELALLYEARLRGETPPCPERAPLQYADYAVWQRKVLSHENSAYRQSVSWWKKYLAGAPSAIRLPFSRAQVKSDVMPADGMMSWGVDRQVSYRLNVLSSSHGATHTW